jgi:hypothetical protein
VSHFSLSAGWQSLIPGSSSSNKGGRPRSAHAHWKLSGFSNADNDRPLEDYAAYSSAKHTYNCSCSNAKHMCYLAGDTAQRPERKDMHCRACNIKVSGLEHLAYSILDSMPQVAKYATEACALVGAADMLSSCGELQQVSQHKYDIMTIIPPKLLIQVQGQQHYDKPMGHTNNRSHHNTSAAERDELLGIAARSAGFTMCWLVPGDERNRADRWRRILRQAVQHVIAGRPPHHFEQ